MCLAVCVRVCMCAWWLIVSTSVWFHFFPLLLKVPWGIGRPVPWSGGVPFVCYGQGCPHPMCLSSWITEWIKYLYLTLWVWSRVSGKPQPQPQHGVTTDPKKIEAVASCSCPSTVLELRCNLPSQWRPRTDCLQSCLVQGLFTCNNLNVQSDQSIGSVDQCVLYWHWRQNKKANSQNN